MNRDVGIALACRKDTREGRPQTFGEISSDITWVVYGGRNLNGLSRNGRKRMCLAAPMQLVSKENNSGIAEIGGVKREICLQLLPDAEVGDYVIVHAGFAIQKLNDEEAQKTIELLGRLALDASTELA